MGRFGIGARVRDADGDLATVIENPGSGKRVIRFDDPWLSQSMTIRKKFLTLVEAAPAAQEQAEAWVPKVGDRVKGTQNPIEYDVDAVNGDGTIDVSRPGVITGKTLRYTKKALSLFKPLPVAEQPTGLWAPVVGKYGKTRDGRKVGPILAYPHSDYFHVAAGTVAGNQLWDVDGTALQDERKNDLIAEWDEPESPVIAVTTPEPSAAPAKFKVGDRVTPKADKLRKVVGHWEEHWQRGQGRAHADVFYVVSEESSFIGLRISVKPDGDGPYWPAEFFELVDAAPTQVGAATTPTESFIVARLTAKGEPRPNARPRVHVTMEAANEEAQRLADRLGDEFAVYQRVSSRTVDAVPVPEDFEPDLAKAWVSSGYGSHAVNGRYSGMAFSWGKASQGFWLWDEQRSSLTPLGRAILRKWIAEAEANQIEEAA